jgi:hypothetical protein
MTGMMVRNSLVSTLAALLVVSTTAACTKQPAAESVTPQSVAPRVTACVEAKKIIDEAEESLKQMMMAGKSLDPAKGKAETEELAAKLKAVAPSDAELGPLLTKQAEEMVWAFEFLTAPDMEVAASMAPPGGGETSAYDAIFDLCVSHWKPDLNAADRAVVTGACKKIADALTADSAKAAELLAKIKGGTLVGSAALVAQQDLAATWNRIASAYGDVSADLSGEGKINEFRRAVNALRSAYETAAFTVTEPDGVAEAEKQFATDRTVQGQKMFDLYCA